MCIRDSPNGEWGDKIMELMDAVDTWIPNPERDTDKPFLMPIEDIFLSLIHILCGTFFFAIMLLYIRCEMPPISTVHLVARIHRHS